MSIMQKPIIIALGIVFSSVSLWGSSPNSKKEKKNEAAPQPLVRVVANPEKFHDSEIIVTGWLCKKDGAILILPSRSQVFADWDYAAIALQGKEIRHLLDARFDEKPLVYHFVGEEVHISGVFKARSGVFCGIISVDTMYFPDVARKAAALEEMCKFYPKAKRNNLVEPTSEKKTPPKNTTLPAGAPGGSR